MHDLCALSLGLNLCWKRHARDMGDQRRREKRTEQDARIFMLARVLVLDMREVHRANAYAVECDRDIKDRAQTHVRHHHVIDERFADVVRVLSAKRPQFMEDLRRPRGAALVLASAGLPPPVR